MNNKLYVAPRTYNSFAGVSTDGYNYTQLIAAYDEKDNKLLAVKIIDNFSKTDKYGEYSELISLDKLSEDVVIKTFLFEDLDNIEPVTNFGEATYH